MGNAIMKPKKILQLVFIGLAQALSAQEGPGQRITHPTFGPGRLDESFLAIARDPWVLETQDPDDPGHRDAFLGNGWLGQRFGIAGEAKAGGLIHGFWDHDGLMKPPLWGMLEFNDGEKGFQPGIGLWQNYRQRLDLRTATLITEVDWNSGTRSSHIVTRCWLSRSRPGVAVIEREVTPQFDGEVKFVDRLDGRGIKDAAAWRTGGSERFPQEPIALSAKFGPRERLLAISSRLFIEGAKPTLGVVRQDQMIERTVTLQAKIGKTLRVVKVVGMATDAECASPWLTAFNLAEAGAYDLSRLRTQHEAAWAVLWQSRIEVAQPAVQQILNASLYQLYASVRAGTAVAVGPGGLSAALWGGRAFWDADLWMFPGLCLLQPELGRSMVEYRHRTLPGAFRNAEAEGYQGAWFAWKSAEFGDDQTTVPFRHQRHINTKVALAQWWYALISGDEPYLREKALPVILASAEFWADRALYNAAKDRYEIRRVVGPDENAGLRDNNATTNYGAAWTLRLAARLARRYDLPCPPEWETIASKIWIPFDEKNQHFLEFDGYDGHTIKQADTVMLVYPFAMSMPDQVKANTVDYYRQRYPKGNIMMAAAFDGIVDCELGRVEKGWESFLRLLPHFRMPYLLASEGPANEGISFATGLGGTLQLVMMGYAGLRIEADGLVVQPCVPPELGTLALRQIHYGGVAFDLEIQDGKASITHASGSIKFKITDRTGKRIPRVK